jgi:hypothetical protein
MSNTMSRIEIKHARIIGSLFLMAFLAYGFGRYFFESEEMHIKLAGAFLVLVNSTVVLFIGILLRKTVREYNTLAGNIYLFTRIFEALLLAALVVTLLPGVTIANDYDYLVAMFILGLGSIPMCLTLYKHRIAPPSLALWGAVGYAIFALGFLMELAGTAWSMYLLIPAGLWEVTFAFWLIIKGGKTPSAIERNE